MSDTRTDTVDGTGNGPAGNDVIAFEAERSRLAAVATRLLGDPAGADDIVQQTWLRLRRNTTPIDNLAAWLTTVATRLCLDQLRARRPEPVADPEVDVGRRSVPAAATFGAAADPVDATLLADAVGAALDVVLRRLGPDERVAFILHDSFGYPFSTIATIMGTTPAAARKLASRARARVAQPTPEDALADWEVVDAFMAAARGGDLPRLLELLAPDAHVDADAAAIALGTPTAMRGSDEIAQFFNGAAHAARPVFADGRAAAAWFDRGTVKVVFDFTIADGTVTAITFRGDGDLLATVERRRGGAAREPGSDQMPDV